MREGSVKDRRATRPRPRPQSLPVDVPDACGAIGLPSCIWATIWRSTLNDPAIRGFLVTRGADTFPQPIAFVPNWGDHWAAIKIAIAVRESPRYRWDLRPKGAINLDRPDKPGHVPDAILNQILIPLDDEMHAVESHPFARHAMYMKQSRDTAIRFCLLGPLPGPGEAAGPGVAL
jgi:hypothetical protein